ncbi:hypothetical protein C8241_13660 [Paracidovorax avenae]|uniref:hypothetical protein n=1 Tax=Paracidovorax avenae TaxID=80867 RepID=UPI000D156460|nr:hypothetical protein [Paracidovorax avenae]AVS62599.1 hypothetical protein C8241_13660 [Paracidovorax avenae]AVS85355.1 hypothetical protein C8239_11815 [Paracidovorax avenae]AVT06396.1 hypothetical protein C8248_10845 [Paracidovorax avenae]
MTKSRSFAAIAAAAGVGLALLAASGAAQARDVYWSIGVNSPGVSVGVGAGPGVIYSPPVTYVAPPPVYYSPPAPVYYAPPPVAYMPPPRPVYYAPPPPPVVYGGYGYYNRPPHWHRGGYWR